MRNIRKRERQGPMCSLKTAIGTAVLVTGLALGCGGKSDTGTSQKPSTGKKADKSSCGMKALEGSVNMVSVKQGRCKVREGDELGKVELLFEKAGHFTLKVGKIDNEGVEVPLSTVFMSERSSDKASPTKVKYGKTTVFRVGELALSASLSVKAERGSEPGTAVLTVKYTGPKTL